MPAKKQAAYNFGEDVLDLRHTEAKRKNIPPAGLAAQGKLVKEKKLQYAYNPHLPPRLLFDATGRADRLNELLALIGTRDLFPQEIEELRSLAQADPWLQWSGKQEEQACVVDPVALHIHERVSTQAILKMARREALSGKVQMIYCDFPCGINTQAIFNRRLGRRTSRTRIRHDPRAGVGQPIQTSTAYRQCRTSAYGQRKIQLGSSD